MLKLVFSINFICEIKIKCLTLCQQINNTVLTN